MTVDRGQNLDVRPVLGDPRRADEHRPQRTARQTGQLERGLKAVQLTPERVAPRADVHQAEMVAVEHDQPGARAHHRDAAARERAQRIGQPLALDPQRHRRGLPSGDHQALEVGQVGGCAHLAHLRAQPVQHARVRLKAAL
jgi:hypothetical protein